MFYVYWQQNIKAPIRLQTDGTNDIEIARRQADVIAKQRKVGSIIVLKMLGFVPDMAWTMGSLRPYTVISFKNAKFYLADYRQIKVNGKRRWVKSNKKQLGLFDE